MSRSDFFDAESIAAFGAAVHNELAKRQPDKFSKRRAAKPAAKGRRISPVKRLQRVRMARPTSPLSPRLSYGRHRGPARADSRRAAVLIVIYPHRCTGRLCLTLTTRPQALSHHGGQVCLPGGRIEAGETPIEAALREYEEELGVPVDVLEIIGRLVPIYVFASDNLVETLVVTANTPQRHWQPDPAEVDEVIEMPLEGLLNLTAGALTVAAADEQPGDADWPADVARRSGRPAPCEIKPRKKDRIGKGADTGEVFQYEFHYQAIEFVDCEGHRRELWGATAMLLDEFARVIRRAMVGRP